MKFSKKYKMILIHIDSDSDTQNRIKYKPHSTASFLRGVCLAGNKWEEYCQSIIASTRKLKK
jgi:hypothetical protein